jgi:MoaA/NifB/PqqE/SkfB family radical SAM enzyme
MSSAKLPSAVIWDLTYACPLRCTHCYSESGRRPSRQLPLEDALRVVDVIIAMRPRRVYLSGGEPLVVKGLRQIVEKLTTGGIPVEMNISGFGVDEESAAWISSLYSMVHVSVDGADAATHDFIRGVAGSFDNAMNALSLFDRLAAQAREGGVEPLCFGIAFAVVRSNFHHIERLSREIAPRFPHLASLSFGTAIPAGLASREGYADLELCTDEERAVLRDVGFRERVEALAPAVRKINIFDALGSEPHNDGIAATKGFRNVMHIEPDGRVRAISQYEGIVGNVLEESPDLIWARARERQHDPFLVQELSRVRTMKDWAIAVRNIDRRFGSSVDLVRISTRKEYTS